MSLNKLNYEITLYNSPYYDNLIQELLQINKQKKNILRKIKSEEDYRHALGFEEKKFLQHITQKEGEILKEIIALKYAFNFEQSSDGKLNSPSFENDDFDIYRVNLY